MCLYRWKMAVADRQASATMVTAILPSMTAEDDKPVGVSALTGSNKPNARLSVSFSVESEVTITPERYTRALSGEPTPDAHLEISAGSRKASTLAGYVGFFAGCGALVALVLFLPLPALFGHLKKVTPGQAVSYSFYVVAAVSFLISLLVFLGLRGLEGEENKGWRRLFSLSEANLEEDLEEEEEEEVGEGSTDAPPKQVSRLPDGLAQLLLP